MSQRQPGRHARKKILEEMKAVHQGWLEDGKPPGLKWDEVFPEAFAGAAPTPFAVRYRCARCGRDVAWIHGSVEKDIVEVGKGKAPGPASTEVRSRRLPIDDLPATMTAACDNKRCGRTGLRIDLRAGAQAARHSGGGASTVRI